MPAKFMLLIMLTVGLILTSCSDQTVVQPQTTLRSATDADAVALRPIRDFLANQGTYCLKNEAGECEFFHPPVPNFLCWCDPATGVMASVDYAAVVDHWIQEESSGQMSCGTGCRGQVLEVPQLDGTARVSVIMETKTALSWAEKPNRRRAFGEEAPEVLQGKDPIFGQARLEVEFSLPFPGAPIPDLVQMLYAPLAGQEVYSIKFYASASGQWRGKPARMEVFQGGLMNPSPGIAGIPAQVTIEWLDHPGQNGPDKAMK